MKYLKTLGLLAVAVATLTAFAGTASATFTVTTKYEGEIVATSTSIQLHTFIDINCNHSEVRGTPTFSGATTIEVAVLTFSECGRTMTTTAKGHIVIDSNGDIRSTGARITVQTSIFGFPVHCIYATNNTKIGTLTEGVAPAKWHIGSSPIPQEETSGYCGNNAVLTGGYTFTTPSSAMVVD